MKPIHELLDLPALFAGYSPSIIHNGMLTCVKMVVSSIKEVSESRVHYDCMIEYPAVFKETEASSCTLKVKMVQREIVELSAIEISTLKKDRKDYISFSNLQIGSVCICDAPRILLYGTESMVENSGGNKIINGSVGVYYINSDKEDFDNFRAEYVFPRNVYFKHRGIVEDIISKKIVMIN